MPAWLPLLKASLPYVAQIVTTAVPAFTSKPETSKQADPVVNQQIEELQAAATNNAESIHVLAEKLQQTIEGIDLAATDLQNNLAKTRRYLMIATSTAIIALIVAVWALIQ